ncbi:hypothetical protein LguiA_004578 [Lonicera macranthoides]
MATELRQVDPTIWRACAGNSVKIPTVDSRVYYFPQGHAEQSSSPPLLSPRVSSQPSVYCRVLAVKYLASPETDEVFARIRLVPLDRSRDKGVAVPDLSREPYGEGAGRYVWAGAECDVMAGSGGDVSRDRNVMAASGGYEETVVSFAKILTPSDANNGGGFSVPRFCADSIFPRLNFEADPPVQNISVTDIHGTVWEFRHIYRGTPRRHLLTTGWSKFVNSKKLVAGDSVVFMRNTRSGELFVGIRRAVRFNADCGGRWNCPVGSSSLRLKGDDEGFVVKEGFSRNGRGKISPEAVAEAAELAAQGMAFEIVYYPRAGWADFVVKAETVEESLNVFWTAGMRVKMAMETEDSSRMTWFQGTVSSAMVSEIGPWRGSPWRMLQVTWDEPEVLQNVKRVSPWQVEYVVPTPSLHPAFHPTKKFRAPQNTGLLPDGGEGELLFPVSLSNSMMIGGHLNSPSSKNYTSFPAGMQGARQDEICLSSLSNFRGENANQMCTEDFFGNKVMAPLVSTELNIGSSHSDNLSPDSQSSVHFFGTDISNRGCNSSTKDGVNSFQLFGKIIHMNEPPVDGGGGFDDSGGCTDDEGAKVYKESEVVSSNQLNLSLTYPCTKLFDGIDVQYRQRASAIEACRI